ncbi:MAG: TRAP transporter small permease [Desulfomonilia bacterium]
MNEKGPGNERENTSSSTRRGSFLHCLSVYTARFEDILVAVFLGAMILLVLIQIVLRNVYATGIMGGAEIVRHLVLWVAFIGAGLAAREGKHIRIDLAGRLLPLRLREICELITGIFSVIICCILVYASINFVLVDYHTGTTIAFLEFPVWILAVIIPVGYLAVTLRFALRCVDLVRRFMRGW